MEIGNIKHHQEAEIYCLYLRYITSKKKIDKNPEIVMGGEKLYLLLLFGTVFNCCVILADHKFFFGQYY